MPKRVSTTGNGRIFSKSFLRLPFLTLIRGFLAWNLEMCSEFRRRIGRGASGSDLQSRSTGLDGFLEPLVRIAQVHLCIWFVHLCRYAFVFKSLICGRARGLQAVLFLHCLAAAFRMRACAQIALAPRTMHSVWVQAGAMRVRHCMHEREWVETCMLTTMSRSVARSGLRCRILPESAW